MKMDTRKSKKIDFFGIPFAISCPTQQFVILAVLHLFCASSFAFLQEKAALTPGFHDSGGRLLLTLIPMITTLILATLEIVISSIISKKKIIFLSVPIINYFYLSFLTYGGIATTAWGLKYLSYPTRIVFKGSKPIPTMILEWIYVGEKFTISEIFTVGTLTLGIISFCLGDAVGNPSFHYYGIILLCIGVGLDAATSTFEKKKLFKMNAPYREALFYTGLFGSFYSLFELLMSNEPIWIFTINNIQCIISIIMSSISAYLSAGCILQLISNFTATGAECVKGARKVISILLSYLLLGEAKEFNFYHGIGILLLSVSIGISIKDAQTKDVKKIVKKI
eukprot:GHVL01025198.1.p1 GENE.GHVL01025198.1~~GHVL01025198.1.p1  ORF type:complete len:337 (+),score=58.96 GHVL01025198.1:66-1076(+)